MSFVAQEAVDAVQLPEQDAAQFMIPCFLIAKLAFEFGFVFLGYSGKIDDNMRFTRRVHGRPTRTKVAIKMCERTVRLLGTLVTRRAKEHKFYWEGFQTLNGHVLQEIRQWHVREKKMVSDVCLTSQCSGKGAMGSSKYRILGDIPRFH
jgi:hypothetical protein